jgi:hypothetical protein
MDDLINSHWLGALRGPPCALAPAGPFVLAGLEWAAPHRVRIELRARDASGRWSPWTLASVQGHDADLGEAVAPACFGEPVWTGAAGALELRSDRPVTGLTVHLVAATPARPARAGRAGAALPLATPQLPAGPGQPPIIARRAWAGDRGPASPNSYGDVRMMFVHHSANANGYRAADVPAMLLSIYRYHRYVRGWNDIGYNFAVDAFGRIWEARAGGIDQAVVGAQAGGYNLESSGVVMLGTFSGVLPTPAALAALARLVAWKTSLHGVPVSGDTTVEVDPSDASYTRFRPGQRVTLPRIAGHRDGCTTDCPGDALYAHLPALRADVKVLAGPQLALSLDVAGGQNASPARDLRLASVAVLAGSTLALEGRLQAISPLGVPGAPVVNATVELEALVGSTATVLEDVGGPFSLTTAGDGRFTAQLTPTHNLLVRALRPDAQAVASPLVAVGVAPLLTLTVDPDAGAPPRLSGIVLPHKRTLTLEIDRVGGARRPTRTEVIHVRADGTFSVAPTLTPGAYVVRVVSPADADNLAGASARVKLGV